MRRVVGLFLVCALAVAGCGSSSAGSASPLSSELSYFPANSPFVMSVQTAPNASAVHGMHALIAHFPQAQFGLTALMGQLDQLGIDYQSDIRPLLGNPVMIGATSQGVSPGGATASAVGVWVTKDSAKLNSLLKKLPGVHSVGTRDGATLYQMSGSTTFAVDGATLVYGSSSSVVNAALDRHRHGGGLREADFAKAFSGLPQNSLLEAFGNLTGVLSRPSAAKARQVPWVAALRGYATSISANSTGLSFQYRLDTSARQLTSSQLPLATTSTPPNFAGRLPITVGVENPAQIFTFAESAEQQTSPGGWAKYQRRQAALRARTGVDLDSLIKLTTGSLIVGSDTHTTLGRVAVSDPRRAATTLAKLMSDPQAVFTRATGATRLGGGFYAIKEHRSTITVGIAGNQLVAGKATPAQLRAFAATTATPAAGAHGSVAFRIALSQLLGVALKHAPPQVAQAVLSSLGDITGWTAATPSALTGTATLAVR